MTHPILFLPLARPPQRIFDLRVPARDAITSTRAEHPDWVVNVHMQDGSDRAVVSGSAVRFFFFFFFFYFFGRRDFCVFFWGEGGAGASDMAKLVDGVCRVFV